MHDLSEFPKDFASARTFVFVKEIESLLNNNLVKGGDLDNAIVIYDKPIEQEKFDLLADMLGAKRKRFYKARIYHEQTFALSE
jgi:UDP-3-O-acyl-N-acetylglucosamine deacetylase